MARLDHGIEYLLDLSESCSFQLEMPCFPYSVYLRVNVEPAPTTWKGGRNDTSHSYVNVT